MRYSEFAAILNEHYDTDIFYSKYDMEIFEHEKKKPSVNVRIQGLNDISVTADAETLELLGIYQHSCLEFSVLKSISKSVDNEEELDKEREKNKQLSVELQKATAEIEEMKPLSAINRFAQDTILKAIAGEKL